MGAFYKAVLNGSYAGQKIVNVLAYRVGVGIDVAGFAIGGAQALANCIKDQVWPALKAASVSGYQLEDVTVAPYHGESLELMYQNPFTLPILENGALSDVTNGPAETYIYKFFIEPTLLGVNGLKPPKRGYLAVGPCQSDFVDNDGKISSSTFLNPTSTLNNLATALAANLESLLPPVIFFPIRLKTEKVLGLVKITSWADVGGCSIRRNISFRRSRQTE